MEVKDSRLQKTYYFSDRDNTIQQVAKGKEETAAKIDQDDKFFLSDQEITNYLEESLILKKDVTPEAKEEIIADFKLALQDKGKEIRDIYPSYEEVVNDLKDLETKYPDLAKVVKLNDKPTADGRDIIALKISKGAQGDTNTKTGVIITGVHHAREWAGAVASQNTAHYLLENYATDEKVKRRVDNAEIWIVPLVNPDGYEYSRNEDRYWRKDREKFEKNGRVTYGIDANRNYWDGKKENYRLYRPIGDTPDNYRDDYGASDVPSSDLFRGLEGATSVGVKALLDLELGRKNIKAKLVHGEKEGSQETQTTQENTEEALPNNIKGVIDFHSYGNSVLYPLGCLPDPLPNESAYKELCHGMVKTMDTKYKVIKSYSMYPSTGSSDVITADGIMELTLELGTTFFPKERELGEIKKDTNAANNYFIDWIIDHFPQPQTAK